MFRNIILEDFNSRYMSFRDTPDDLLMPIIDPSGVTVGIKLSIRPLSIHIIRKIQKNPLKGLKDFIAYLQSKHPDIYIKLGTGLFINYYGDNKSTTNSKWNVDYFF